MQAVSEPWTQKGCDWLNALRYIYSCEYLSFHSCQMQYKLGGPNFSFLLNRPSPMSRDYLHFCFCYFFLYNIFIILTCHSWNKFTFVLGIGYVYTTTVESPHLILNAASLILLQIPFIGDFVSSHTTTHSSNHTHLYHIHLCTWSFFKAKILTCKSELVYQQPLYLFLHLYRNCAITEYCCFVFELSRLDPIKG